MGPPFGGEHSASGTPVFWSLKMATESAIHRPLAGRRHARAIAIDRRWRRGAALMQCAPSMIRRSARDPGLQHLLDERPVMRHGLERRAGHGVDGHRLAL